MVRLSKKQEIRQRSPHRRRPPAAKSGPRKMALPLGYKPHCNAVDGDETRSLFIAKIR